MTNIHTGGAARPRRHQPKEMTLQELAAEEFARAGEDAAVAEEAMVDRLLNDRSLRENLLIPLLRTACRTAIGMLFRSARSVIWNGPSAAANRSRLETAGAVNMLTLMQFQLPGGKLLGEATREEVKDAAYRYLAQGSDMMHKGRWLTSIAEAMPSVGSKKVRQVLTEPKLNEMKKATA